MSRVVTYGNNKYQRYCQIQFDSGERVLINVASKGIKIQLRALGFIPIRTVWEYNRQMAGVYQAYANNIVCIVMNLSDRYPSVAEKFKNDKYVDPRSNPYSPLSAQPLNILRDCFLCCHSLDEAHKALFDAERCAREFDFLL